MFTVRGHRADRSAADGTVKTMACHGKYVGAGMVEGSHCAGPHHYTWVSQRLSGWVKKKKTVKLLLFFVGWVKKKDGWHHFSWLHR